MKSLNCSLIRRFTILVAVLASGRQMALGQAAIAWEIPSPVPAVLKFNGTIRNLKKSDSLQSLTFSLYEAQQGGPALWSETESVSVDDQGRYTAYLGSASGLAPQLFASGAIRWIGVTPSDGVERARIPITTVPYAFKAADAEMFGGKLPEEFVTREQLPALVGNTTTSGTVSVLIGSPSSGPMLPDGVSQSSGSDLRRALSTPVFAQLRTTNTFQKTQSLAGGASLPPISPETGQSGFTDSAPLDFESSVAVPSSGTSWQQIFRWVSQPTPSSSGTPGAKLSLLFGANSEPSPTGLSVNSDGTINFAPGQVLPAAAVMDALSGGQSGAGGTGGSLSPFVNTSGYVWAETPARSAIKVGANVVTLTPCPPGVNGSDLWHYLYIAKTGVPEVVLITGGTCTSRKASGTIAFTAQHAHHAGYSIGSATDGAQEAVVDAGVPGAAGQLARSVIIDAGSHVFRARLSVRDSSITVSGSGAAITCAMEDTCIMLGDPANSNEFMQIAISGLQIVAGVPNGTWPTIEDNASTTLISQIDTANSPIPHASLGSLIQVDNDQAATIRGLVTNHGGWSRCDSSFCSTAIVGAGAKNDAGVITVEDSNLSLGCTANGIDNQDSNTLKILNTEIQAYPQFAVRSSATFGTTPNVLQNGVYEEIGNCVNPLGTGMAGLIVEGGYAQVNAGAPDGELPRYANTGTTANFNYWIVVHSSVMGTSSAYLAGNAFTDGTGMIPVLWNQVGSTGVITYDVLRTPGITGSAPYGTGPFAVATGIPITSCVNKVCSFVDDASSQPATYTVLTNGPYWPALKLWPGSVILTTLYDYQNTGGGTPTQYITDVVPGGVGAGITNSAGAIAPSVFSSFCQPQGTVSSIWIQCVGGDAVSNDNPAVIGTLLQAGGNGDNPGGLKGRLNFTMPVGSETAATHIITLADSNPAKTQASQNKRPAWDATDTYIGFDQPSNTNVINTQLATGAPVSISGYIGNPGDNVSWGERLTRSAKFFQVPVTAMSDVTVDGNLVLYGSCLGNGCGPFSSSGPGVKLTFNQPSGPLGSNWTTTAGTWNISNGQATFVGDGGSTDANSALVAYTGGNFGSDQYAMAQIVFSSAGTNAAGVGVRMSNSAETGYVCFARRDLTMILKYVNGTRSGFGIQGPGFPSGDYLTAQVIGNTLSCLDNGKQIPGVTVTDSSSPLVSGYPGMFGEYSVSSFINNFSAGNASYTAASPVTFADGLQLSPTVFANLATCSSSTEGTQRAIADSTANTWGATITGGGVFHVLAYCDGSEWTVSAK